MSISILRVTLNLRVSVLYVQMLRSGGEKLQSKQVNLRKMLRFLLTFFVSHR